MMENEGYNDQLYKNLTEFASFCFLSYNGGAVRLTDSLIDFPGQLQRVPSH
jgi:hypothetical protein